MNDRILSDNSGSGRAFILYCLITFNNFVIKGCVILKYTFERSHSIMKIKDILETDKITISFEVFPPKKADGLEKVRAQAEEIAALQPDFMSVT